MRPSSRSGLGLLVCLLLGLAWRAPQEQTQLFAYDPVEELRTPQWLRSSEAYDAAAGTRDGELQLAYVEFAPTRTTSLVRGTLKLRAEQRTRGSRLASPSLLPEAAPDTGGWGTWTSYEAAAPAGAWQVIWHGKPANLSLGNGIRHRVAGEPKAARVVWQEDIAGSWQIVLGGFAWPDGVEPLVVSSSPRGNWSPDVCVTPKGVCVVWDRYDGTSFDVVARWLVDGELGPEVIVADGPAFQGKARVASDSTGRVYCIWEEGAENWGKPFRGKHVEWNNVTDDYGPLHRHRRLELAVLAPNGSVARLEPQLPQPAFERLAARDDRRPGVEKTGVYYERAELAVDASDRLWVAWRHFIGVQLGCPESTKHHVEQGWRIYASCLEGDAWTAPIAWEGHQRDGSQRLELVPEGHGVALAWTTGRSDRRPKAQGQRGIAYARVAAAPGPASKPELLVRAAREVAAVAPRPAPPAPEELGGVEYQQLLGDLHRHTDLSLCFPYYDGSLDDAYRYATEVAELDFLALTDHTRDIDGGNAGSQLWSRVTAAVDRHQLRGSFTTLHAYERSRGDTDHNVITLDPALLRPFQPPLPEFWALLDGQALTIPHNPIQPATWEIENERHRPLLEIFQGCRDQDSVSQAWRGLLNGQRFGFVASSDHMSTSASYAGVWSTGRSREEIFAALMARRTFGATEPLRLVMRGADFWMGERVSGVGPFPLRALIEARHPIERLRWIQDGAVVDDAPLSSGGTLARAQFTPELEAGTESWIYLEVDLVGGGRAWSSPVFLTRSVR